MDMVDSSHEGTTSFSPSFPRGGPIYVPDHVGPLITVPEFKNLVLDQLQELEDICADSLLQVCEDDLSVNELIVLTEEELINEALKDALQVGQHSNEASQVSDELSISNIESTSSPQCLMEYIMEEDEEDIPEKLARIDAKKRKKRGRTFDRDTRAAELESCCTPKVMELAKRKQNQEKDKAEVGLHSFNATCKNNDDRLSSLSGNTEKMRSLRFITSTVKVKPSQVNEHIPVTYPDVILCVEVYHNRQSWIKTQEFLVLGTQTLTELRDQINCRTDQLMQKAEKYDPSGYFLIEDIFCNNVKDPSAVDYSKPIMDWLQNCKNQALEKWQCILSGELQQKQKAAFGNARRPELPHFKSSKMHEVHFCDLPFRLGAGYLYCHQGDCKHVFVIRDMRLIHPEDEQNRAAYPLLTYHIKLRHRKCSVCNIYRAVKVTVDDKRTPENPCYFCGNCYWLLHHNEDNTLLYDDFTVFDYHKD